MNKKDKATNKVEMLYQQNSKSQLLSERNTIYELQKAKDTLRMFFDYLFTAKYDKAVLLFEPWKEGVGMHASSWEGLSSFSSPENRSDKAKVLKHYCEIVNTCFRAKILNVKKVADDEYKLKIQFLNKDGSTFAYCCCGSTSSETTFDYFVHRIKGEYKVRTPPLFKP